MPLVIAPSNVELKVIKILTNDKIKKHLESLGIIVNGTIKILENSSNIILDVLGQRIALDKDIATHIIVA
jgi:Fe2+ transport system protein FeoA